MFGVTQRPESTVFLESGGENRTQVVRLSSCGFFLYLSVEGGVNGEMGSSVKTSYISRLYK